jgi:hypothetical protein
MTLFDILDRIQTLAPLTRDAVSKILQVPLAPKEEANPYIKVFEGDVREPALHAELDVAKDPADQRGRVVLSPKGAAPSQADVEERYGRGVIGQIIPTEGPEGSVGYEYASEKGKTTFRFTATTKRLLSVVFANGAAA